MDIKTNSNAMFNIIYHSLSLKNCVFENILCIGDRNESSFLLFESNEYGNDIEMKNITISNCKTNSDLIKITGIESVIKISDVAITNSTSYGSILNDISNHVSIIIYIHISYEKIFLFYLLIYYI